MQRTGDGGERLPPVTRFSARRCCRCRTSPLFFEPMENLVQSMTPVVEDCFTVRDWTDFADLAFARSVMTAPRKRAPVLAETVAIDNTDASALAESS